MKPQRYQYAQLPKYQYQTVERHYQTFDRNTLAFSYYPIIHTAADLLTDGKSQDDKEPSAAEPEKESASAEAKPEEPSNSPDESAASSEPAGMYQTRSKLPISIIT